MNSVRISYSHISEAENADATYTPKKTLYVPYNVQSVKVRKEDFFSNEFDCSRTFGVSPYRAEKFQWKSCEGTRGDPDGALCPHHDESDGALDADRLPEPLAGVCSPAHSRTLRVHNTQVY